MDKTTRLIRLQRLTISVLLLVIATLAFTNHAADKKTAQWREDAISAQQVLQRVSENSKADQRIINLMDMRMRNAEREAQKLSAQRNTESVYITRSPDGTLTTR